MSYHGAPHYNRAALHPHQQLHIDVDMGAPGLNNDVLQDGDEHIGAYIARTALG